MTARSLLPGAGLATAALAGVAAGVSVARDLPAAWGEGLMGPLTVRGQSGRVLRDFLTWRGTAIAPPLPMIVAIGALSLAVRRRPGVRRVLGAIGAFGIVGYAGEPRARKALSPSGADRVETPLVAACLAGCAALAVLGLGTR